MRFGSFYKSALKIWEDNGHIILTTDLDPLFPKMLTTLSGKKNFKIDKLEIYELDIKTVI